MLKQFILGCLVCVAAAFPDGGNLGTASHARGVPQGHRFVNKETIQAPAGSASNLINSYAENDLGGGHSGPTKTFYVNVPHETHPIPPPIAAGPPRKHYRIVFIRSPSAPPPQQILPPKVEQKTLIYVLHPRPQGNEQNVVEVPSVQHDPQVYFVQYENEPPTPQDLQNLVKNTLDGEGGTNFNFGGPAGSTVFAGAPSPAQVYPPGPQGFSSGNNVHFKRGVSESKFAQPQLQQASEKVPVYESVPKTKATNVKSASEPQQTRKRPQVIPARVPSSNRRSDVQIEPQEKSKRSSNNSDGLISTPEFKSIFGDTFDSDTPLRFGGKLKPRRSVKEEKTSLGESTAQSDK